jgi:hypothetical protein
MSPEREAAIGRAVLGAVQDLYGLPEAVISARLWQTVSLRAPCTEGELFAVLTRIESLRPWRAHYQRLHPGRIFEP